MTPASRPEAAATGERPMKRTESVVVGSVEDLPPGSVTIVPRGKFGIGVYNVGGTFYALTNYCLHRGAPLCRGQVTGMVVAGDEPYASRMVRTGEFLRCPWHGWEFEIATGRAVAYPERAIRTYPVRVEDGSVILEGL